MIYIIVKLNHQTYCFSGSSIGGRNLCWNRWQLSGQALKPEPPKIRPLWTQTLCWREFWIWSFLRKLETMGEFDLCPTTVKCIFCFNFSLWLKRVGLEVFNQYWRIWFWSVFVRVTFSWKCFVWRNKEIPRNGDERFRMTLHFLALRDRNVDTYLVCCYKTYKKVFETQSLKTF